MNHRFFSEIKRMRELAGITKNPDRKILDEEHYTQSQLLQQTKLEPDISGLVNKLNNASDEFDTTEAIDQDVETAEEIDANAENLYPGKKYYGMYSGEHMMELKDISNLNDDEELLIDEGIFN